MKCRSLCGRGFRLLVGSLVVAVVLLQGASVVRASYSDDWLGSGTLYSSDSGLGGVSGTEGATLTSSAGMETTDFTWSLGSATYTTTVKSYTSLWTWLWDWDAYLRYLNSYCERYPRLCSYHDDCEPEESAPVPEPSAWLLLGVGALVAALVARGRVVGLASRQPPAF